ITCWTNSRTACDISENSDRLVGPPSLWRCRLPADIGDVPGGTRALPLAGSGPRLPNLESSQVIPHRTIGTGYPRLSSGLRVRPSGDEGALTGAAGPPESWGRRPESAGRLTFVRFGVMTCG